MHKCLKNEKAFRNIKLYIRKCLLLSSQHKQGVWFFNLIFGLIFTCSSSAEEQAGEDVPISRDVVMFVLGRLSEWLEVNLCLRSEEVKKDHLACSLSFQTPAKTPIKAWTETIKLSRCCYILLKYGLRTSLYTFSLFAFYFQYMLYWLAVHSGQWCHSRCFRKHSWTWQKTHACLALY